MEYRLSNKSKPAKRGEKKSGKRHPVCYEDLRAPPDVLNIVCISNRYRTTWWHCIWRSIPHDRKNNICSGSRTNRTGYITGKFEIEPHPPETLFRFRSRNEIFIGPRTERLVYLANRVDIRRNALRSVRTKDDIVGCRDSPPRGDPCPRAIANNTTVRDAVASVANRSRKIVNRFELFRASTTRGYKPWDYRIPTKRTLRAGKRSNINRSTGGRSPGTFLF